MKDYNFKLDVNIWLDRNFTVEANSQREAESKAKAVAKKLLEDAPNIPNGSHGNRELEQLQYYLREWTYGDLQFDVVNVEEAE